MSTSVARAQESEVVRPVVLSAPRQIKLALVRLAIVLACVASVRYFAWRIQWTHTPEAKIFFVIFLIAEMLNFGEALLFYFTSWNPTRYAAPPPLQERAVDVFIPTYNEPVELLRETVACALSMTYPHKTYILDDGDREQVRQLAAEVGCDYISRTDRTSAKAGNLNNALKQTSGEFIVVLDCDHVPNADLIDQLLGFFRDRKVAVVQATQDFYNLDSFQHRLNQRKKYGWQQQELFFNIIQPGKDRYNAAFYCGSPAVIRRSALEQVGGFATESITEDMHTGLLLQRVGWKIIYHNKTVAWGLAPHTYSGFATQWLRWGHGAMQVLRREKPMFDGRLSIAQRICYFSSFYFYWMSYQRLIFLVTPIICLSAGVFPLRATPELFVLYFFPYFFLNLFASATLQGGFRAFFYSEQFNIMKMHVLLHAVSGLVKKKMGFSVTPKARAGAATSLDVFMPASLLFLTVISIAAGTLRLRVAGSEYIFWALVVNLVWAVFFGYILSTVLWYALSRREQRQSYRFPQQLDIPIEVSVEDGAAVNKHQDFARNLNRTGVSVTLDRPLPTGTKVNMLLTLPTRTVYAAGVVVRNQEYKQQAHSRYANGIRFTEIDSEAQDEISKYLFWLVAPEHAKLLRLTHITQNEESVACQ
ncbi:MAG TPA: glycosyltransferase [Clostridia bacterium]|nr:glycosyltransferase [Clostridia bacterium]